MARRSRALIQEANDAARRALLEGSTGNARDLGGLAWWDGEAGWRASAASVAEEIKARGLDPASTLPLPPDHAVAFGRAVEAIRGRVREHGYTLIDAAKGSNDERRVAIVKVERNGRVNTTDEGTVTCAKGGTTAPYVERADPNGYASDVVTCARDVYFERYTTDDIRTAITGMIDRWHGLPCRAQPPKVVYWIPGGAVDAITRLADAVERIGWGRIEFMAADASNARSVRAVTTAVNTGLEAKLNEFAADAEKYTQNAETRASTLESLLVDGKNLKQQWDLYRAILGASVQAGDARIAKIETTIKARIGANAARLPAGA